ncbi:MAG: polysaccharide biosynthesis/export family protein [Betaproteobacteria bacterium]
MMSKLLLPNARLVVVMLASALAACSSLHFPLDKPAAGANAAPVVASKGASWGDPPALPAVAASAPAVAAVAGNGAYVIGPEDALEISVWKDDTLKATSLVRPDGGISFPLVGELAAAGKTADQLRDELKKRLEKYIPDAVVTVAVARVASYRIYVLGRVNKPGDFAVGRDVDILQALTLAGGLTPFAHDNDIRVVRKVDGKSVTIAFRYADALNDGDLSQNITLRSGDVVLVP